MCSKIKANHNAVHTDGTSHKGWLTYAPHNTLDHPHKSTKPLGRANPSHLNCLLQCLLVTTRPNGVPQVGLASCTEKRCLTSEDFSRVAFCSQGQLVFSGTRTSPLRFPHSVSPAWPLRAACDLALVGACGHGEGGTQTYGEAAFFFECGAPEVPPYQKRPISANPPQMVACSRSTNVCSMCKAHILRDGGIISFSGAPKPVSKPRRHLHHEKLR